MNTLITDTVNLLNERGSPFAQHGDVHSILMEIVENEGVTDAETLADEYEDGMYEATVGDPVDHWN